MKSGLALMEEQAGGALLRGGGSNDWMVLALCDEKGEEATRTATTVGYVVLCSSNFESCSVMSLSTLCSHTWIAWMPPPSLVHQLLVSSVT